MFFEQMFQNVNVFLANVLKCKWNASSFEVFFEQRRGRLSKSGKGVHLIFKLWTLLPQIPAIQLEDNFVFKFTCIMFLKHDTGYNLMADTVKKKLAKQWSEKEKKGKVLFT